MKINYAQQVDISNLLKMEFDMVICSSGYEKRSPHLFSKIQNTFSVKNARKICFSFTDREVLSKGSNDHYFITNDFELISFRNISLNDTIEMYKEIFKSFPDKETKILIDYSCMTKIMYAGLVKYFSLSENFQQASIFFSYTIALYSEPSIRNYNLHNQPIPLFPTVELTDKKIALLASLGYEEGKAQGLVEYLQIDNADIYLFLTRNNRTGAYYEKVREQNRYILNKIPIENQFEYELENVTQIFNLLESLCNYLISKSFRVIIAPLGPKVFSLISVLLTLKYNDLTVLRISDGVKGSPIDRIPDETREPIIIEANFINELVNNRILIAEI